MAKIVIFANDESTIFNFRREILEALVKNKHKVIVCYPLGEHSDEIRKIGCKLINIEVSRHGKNFLQDFKLFIMFREIIKKFRPDVVLTYTVKPNIYGSYACVTTKTPYINNITGLGSVLQKESILSKFILFLQKLAYKKSSCVFFQNSENCDRMRKKGIISDRVRTYILPGSGVNLQKQAYEKFPLDDGITRFIIVSRIREDKGYNEFFDAAETVKAIHPDTEFHVVGWYEEDSLRSRLDDLTDKGVIIYHGQKVQEEVHELVSSCNCLVHPSYHEGMANVLLEAAATGRPVIGSDIPGCRETFDDGKTGLSCKPKSSESLVKAMEKIIEMPYEAQVEMGRKGRSKMEKEFDRQFVAQKYLDEINKIVRK